MTQPLSPVREPASTNEATRCVIVLDQELPGGRSANAAAVLALTIGERHPHLVGEPLIDAAGAVHPGLIPYGITVLSTARQELNQIRQQAMAAGCDVIDFPIDGQLTKDYRAFQEAVAVHQPEEIAYAGVALVGRKKDVRRIVGHLPLL